MQLQNIRICSDENDILANHLINASLQLKRQQIADAETVIFKKNTAMIISEILQCSRQNVDSIIRRGNCNKIRELDYVALQYVKNIYGGK